MSMSYTYWYDKYEYINEYMYTCVHVIYVGLAVYRSAQYIHNFINFIF